MTTTDWLVPGAQVAEEKNSTYTFTTVKRVTDTEVVLDNGSRYRRDTMRKVGEKTSGYYGANGPTRLVTAEEARSRLTQYVITEAADAVSRAAYRAHQYSAPAAETLDKMQAAIDEARRKLAELDPEAKLDTEATS